MASYVLVFLIVLAIIYGLNAFIGNRMSQYFYDRTKSSVENLANSIGEEVADNNFEGIPIIIKKYNGVV